MKLCSYNMKINIKKEINIFFIKKETNKYNMKRQHIFKNRGVKTIMAGDAGVGKTSIVYRITHDDTFPLYSNSTIGASFCIHRREIGEDSIKLELWDTGGQERYRSLVPMYIRDSMVIILCYDVSETEIYNIDRVNYWLDYIFNYLLDTTSNVQPLIYIVGNKFDLLMKNKNEFENENSVKVKLKRSIQNIINDKRTNLSSNLKLKNIKLKHIIISAKSGYNFNELWDCIAIDSIEQLKRFEFEQTKMVSFKNDEDLIIRTKQQNENENKNKSKCCSTSILE